MMDIVRKVGESCSQWLKMTVDTEDEHENGKVPMLDVEVWWEGKNNIKHQFYEKDIASNRVIMAKSAMSKTTKIASLSQEVVRRMANTGRNVREQNRVDILNKFMEKMRRSGYREKTREEIL